MSQIHSTAIVDPHAQIAENVTIGPYSIIDRNVEIASHTQIGSHVVIRPYTKIGSHCRIFSGAVIGEEPQDLSFDPDKKSFCDIGDHTIIREHVTIHRGTKENTHTQIGHHCFIMAGAHVAHNCKIANQAIIANGVLLGGYVELGERCFLGGGGVYQQFSRIGKLAICSGNIAINVDIPPFTMAVGYRPWIRGLNMVGLRRAGYSKDSIERLKTCYKIVYRENLSPEKAFQKVEQTCSGEEIKEFIDFCQQKSKYPICTRIQP